MIPVERQKAILGVLRSSGSASISDLATLLDVSHMTVRRDIHALEQAGRVMSVSGGVTLPERLALDESHATKTALRPTEKQAIAQAASAMVREGDLVFLDAGTTTLAIADRLADRSGLTFLTNDLAIAMLLSERSECELYVAAGAVDRANLSTEGTMVSAAIGEFNIDIAFLSTPAFDLRGTSVPSGAKKVVKQAVVGNATRTILVTDSTKYGRVAALRAVKLSQLDAIITDTSLPESAIDAIRDQGIALHLVDSA